MSILLFQPFRQYILLNDDAFKRGAWVNGTMTSINDSEFTIRDVDYVNWKD